MNLLVLKLLLAPALIAAATLVARRFGPALGGWVSALPFIAGPVLLIFALEHGAAFAQRAAAGTLLGMVSLVAFIVVYVRLAPGRGVVTSLFAGWVAFFSLTAATARWDPSVAVAGAAVVIALGLGGALARELDPSSTVPAPGGGSGLLLMRVLATAALVLLLSALGGVLGPHVGGMLAAFPVLASLLAAFTHLGDGGRAAAALLRGMITGLVGFAGFCLVAALTLASWGLPLGFLAASLAALALHGTTLPLVARGEHPTREAAAARGAG